MYSSSTVVRSQTGLHARPAAELVQAAKGCPGTVTVRNVSTGGAPVNAKSLLSIMGADFTCGSIIEVAADGECEQVVVDAVIALVDADT